MRRVRAAARGPDVAALIAANFDGDASIHHAFAAACAPQFALDAAARRAACGAGDCAALRWRPHDLESVLALLGHADPGHPAGRVEVQAATAELAAATRPWCRLQAGLLRRGAA